MAAIDRLHTWATAQPTLRVFTVIVRVLLALAFVPSGLVKILGEPFTTLPVSDPVGYFFAGFFSAHSYYQFIGVAQWVAGGLLLIPRTATLGALVYPKQQHAFMGLLTCARCGCSITAERKKGKYTYYRCTGFHGPCGNAYIREERLSALLGDVV
jgi:hypothetical protein